MVSVYIPLFVLYIGEEKGRVVTGYRYTYNISRLPSHLQSLAIVEHVRTVTPGLPTGPYAAFQ